MWITRVWNPLFEFPNPFQVLKEKVRYFITWGYEEPAFWAGFFVPGGEDAARLQARSLRSDYSRICNPSNMGIGERDAPEGIAKKGDVGGPVQGAVPRKRDCGTCSTTLDTPQGVAIKEELDAKRPVPSLFWLLTGGAPSSHARRDVLRVQRRPLVHTD